jgi:hypothetical protein
VEGITDVATFIYYNTGLVGAVLTRIFTLVISKRLEDLFFLIPPFPEQFEPFAHPKYIVPFGRFLARIEEQQHSGPKPIRIALRDSRRLLDPFAKTFMLPRVVLPSQWSEDARSLWRSIPYVVPGRDPGAKALSEKAIRSIAKIDQPTFHELVHGTDAARGWLELGWVCRLPNSGGYYRTLRDDLATARVPKLVVPKPLLVG